MGRFDAGPYCVLWGPSPNCEPVSSSKSTSHIYFQYTQTHRHPQAPAVSLSKPDKRTGSETQSLRKPMGLRSSLRTVLSRRESCILIGPKASKGEGKRLLAYFRHSEQLGKAC